MAMNFKIFDNKETLSVYTADILRKQVHNNPTSLLALEMNEDLNWAYEKFVGETKQHPADFSQVNITLIGQPTTDVLEKLKIPENQFHKDGSSESLNSLLKDKDQISLGLLYLDDQGNVGFNDGNKNEPVFEARELMVVAAGADKADIVRALYNAKENDKDAYSQIKSHRMVTVVLDREAASGLDPDIVDYYSYKFA
ncbi:6-phosphogluconolactonase [Lacicoccus alkaliphilus]|uniref:6-phosphogluconolactonase/Glucosamine-6-phosphate isomerase/deaminase n=1 Tax=Lacicoccus alkaliphilus DSM 16010 TaxID=1123231 RepID=A0A1M7A6P5_9BACL|nr:hypothetical protein [Salinicoccus alkaliphilus]SHL38306.1 6-phosphogluconolactonase/Glucosamine-6-phosphateisomerase/deaminase [Salinicoccus alkaliphilus DSM 16010]